MLSFNYVDQINEDKIGGKYGTYGKEKQYIQRYGWENIEEWDRVEDTAVVGRTILKCILQKQDIREWAALMWLRIGTSGELLWKMQ